MALSPDELRELANQPFVDALNSPNLGTALAARWIRFQALCMVLDGDDSIPAYVKDGVTLGERELRTSLGLAFSVPKLMDDYRGHSLQPISMMQLMRAGLDEFSTEFVQAVLHDAAVFLNRHQFEIAATNDIQVLSDFGPEILLGGLE